MASVQFIDLTAKPSCRGNCNNNCVFCGAGYARPHIDNAKPEVDTERVKLELYKHKDEHWSEVLFSGSGTEPTIRPDIIELLSYANKLGYKHISLDSNGRMFCYPEFTKKIVESGCGSVQIGLHAQNAELHDRITRTPGSFEQTVRGIKNLLEYWGRIKTELIVTIHKLNYRHLPAITRFISNEFGGTYEVKLLPVDVLPIETTEPQMTRKIIVRLSDVRPYLQRGLAILKRSCFRFSIYFMPFCIIDKKYWKNIVGRSMKEELTTYRPSNGVGVGSTFNIFGFCNKCILKEKCTGTWESYTARFGTSEFKPIRVVH